MTSNAFTNEPKRPTTNFGSLTVEYMLHPEDRLALNMFFYDKARAERRRGASFLINRLFNLTCILAAYAYVLLTRLIEKPWQSPIGLAVLGFAVLYLLDTFWPGGLFSGFFRAVHQGRITRLIRTLQRHGGSFNPKWRYRVVMTEQYFVESNDFWEDTANLRVEITEHKETRVWWSAVSSIEVTDAHAFFTVTEKGYLILPRAAFTDEASFMAFVDTARRYRRAAGAMPAPCLQLPVPPDTRLMR